MRITSIKPKVTREQAAKKFKGPIREMRRGRLELVADFYIPYRLFHTSISNAGKTVESHLAIDSVKGMLDLYRFDDATVDEKRVEVETDRVARAALSEAEAFSILKEKIRRSAYLKGFFKIRRFQLQAYPIGRLHIPYWVGVYRRGSAVSLEVIDALRNTFEGQKVREIVTEWFELSGH